MSTLTARITGEIDTAKGSPWRQRALGIELALVANVAILAAARLVTGEFPAAATGGDDQPIGFVPVIVVTLLAGLAAWGLLAILERTTARAKAIWTAIATAVFLLSLLGPLGSGVDTSSKVALALLHLGAAAPIVTLMRNSTAARA